MSKRSYGQNCALALGLDVIGDRWTLLLIRGLLTGPKRYSQLHNQLPSMGTNLLAARLKELTAHGVVVRGADGYELSPQGEKLRPIVHALIRWGSRFRHLAAADATSRPEWDMLAIEAAFRPERAAGVACVIDLTLSDFRFHVVIRNQAVRCVTGAAESADVTARTSTATLLAIGDRRQTLDEAIAAGELELEGSRRAFRQLFRLFELPGE